MTREDIIRMAQEAGLYHFYDSEGDLTGITDAKPIDEDKNRNDDRLVEILARFAALVRADERERIMDEWFTRMQADLEHGVKWLNEHAAEAWRKDYPQMAGFADAVVERSKE